MLILKWCVFHFCVEWIVSNPWSPRAGGLGGAATGSVLGLVFGVLFAVWNWVRSRGKEDAEPGAAPDQVLKASPGC